MLFAHAYLLKRLLLDLLYPNRCGVCGGYIPFDEFFCNTCIKMFSPPPKNICVPYIDLFTAFTVYDSYGKKFIGKLKNESDGYALSGAAYLIYKSLSADLGDKIKEIDVITYIPMRKKDIYKRGYNQCRLIAKELSRLMGKPCRALLVKIRSNRAQKTLSAEDRRENVRGVFRCEKAKAVMGRAVLLIDDVTATGSTISEAARALKESGAVKVFAGIVAKTAFK